VFELPAALSLRLFHPNVLYGSAVIAFGVLATIMSAVRSYAPIMVVRVLLGFAEAFVQTGFVYLSLWYRREEVTTRAGTVSMTTCSRPQLRESSILLYSHTYCWSDKRAYCVRC
jgi:MFS family permease